MHLVQSDCLALSFGYEDLLLSQEVFCAMTSLCLELNAGLKDAMQSTTNTLKVEPTRCKARISVYYREELEP